MKSIPLPSDLQIHHRFTIPDDAERVLIFSESSHWDPNSLHNGSPWGHSVMNHEERRKSVQHLPHQFSHT
jgi:hypothetical protein